MTELEALGVIKSLIGISPSERLLRAFDVVKNAASNNIPMAVKHEFTCPRCNTYNETWKKRANTVKDDKVFCWHCGQSVLIENGKMGK